GAPPRLPGRARAPPPPPQRAKAAEDFLFLGDAAGAKRVEPRAERKHLLALVAVTHERTPALSAGRVDQLGTQTALADACLADHRDHLALARPRGLQCILELSQL